MKKQTIRSQFASARVLGAAGLCALVLSAPACRKARPTGKEAGHVQPALPPARVVPELAVNNIGSLPGGIYQSQANSPIHWQPWTKETLDRAREARKLLFCVVALPQHPGFVETIDVLAKDSFTLETINSQYVPVLIDADASREISLLTAALCSEIRQPIALPLFMWMTHDGAPVAWIPAPPVHSGKTLTLFQQSHSMVISMWQSSWDYMIKNSLTDNENRRGRLENNRTSRSISNQPAVDTERCIRRLVSFYDPHLRSFDEIGGLFPSGVIALLANASVQPGVPQGLRESCQNITREMLKDLLPSAMFDPLDGGVFLAKRGLSWGLPGFGRDCAGQARAVEALLTAYRAIGDPRALELAMGVIQFAESRYQTPNGLFSCGFERSTDAVKWLWTVEDVEKTLPRDDAAWWIQVTGMESMGNLPSESDPRRNFFRRNSIALKKPMAEIAKDLGLTPEAFKPRFDAALAKLKAARDERMGPMKPDEIAHAGASLRMASAYAAAFSATGNVAFRDKAVTLLEKSRDVFFKGPIVRVYDSDQPPSIGYGRAFIYALALQATLDVAAVTSDEKWLVWAEDLATTSAEKFASQGFLKECPDEARIIDLPITDLLMLFDDSTAGLFSNAEFRLAALGRPLVRSFSDLATPLPTYTLERPVLHTDLLLANLGRHHPVAVIFGTNLAPDLKLAVERLSPRMIPRREAKPDDQVPAGSVKVIIAGKPTVVATPEALVQALNAPVS